MKSIGDDITLSQIMRKMASRTPIEYRPVCSHCLDRGYSQLVVTIKKNKYTIPYYCAEKIDEEGAPCLSSRRPLYIAKAKAKSQEKEESGEYRPFAFEGGKQSAEMRNVTVTLRTLLPSHGRAMQIADRFRELESRRKNIAKAPIRQVGEIDVDRMSSVACDDSIRELERLQEICKLAGGQDNNIDLEF